MDMDKGSFRFTQATIRKAPYEYKLRRYKTRVPKREGFVRETTDLEMFSSPALQRKPERSAPVKNVNVRRHLRKRELEFLVKRSSMDGGEQAYRVEVKPVKEESSRICYTLDVVGWEEEPIRCPSIESTLLLDQEFDVEKWEERIVYEDQAFSPNKTDTHLVLDVNDPNLLFDITEEKKQEKKKKKKHGKALGGKYNISNDKNYVETNESLKTILGIQGVQHSIPALKLAPELYKTHLTKEELRFFHRPQMHIQPFSEIRFSAASPAPAKPVSVLKKKRELTLSDFSRFLLLEYTEEIPPLIMNSGMASIVTTFYRKTSSKDINVPSVDLGSLTLLDPKDPSPFMFVGNVKPGEAISSITNNLFKAPVFFHESADFLAIRSEGTYYLRAIKSVGCVGQTLPSEEAFGPHSRRHNVFCKNRLKVAAYRIFYEKGNTERKIHIHQLDAMFPHFSEGSKRKWLKEYAECIRRGKDNVWILKQSAPILGEEDLRRCVTPEQVCQYESMAAEERRLKDAGVVVASTEEEGEAEELKMAVWNLTRNFVNACNGKGLLEINGPADPTGMGEGFSFLRARQKRGEDEERASTSEQAERYREEAKKIWEKQATSLRSKKDLEIPEVEEEVIAEKKPASAEQPEKILSITRTFLRDGAKVQETEVITDRRVIVAYMKARKRMKREEARTSLKCGSCGEVGHMKTNKACVNYRGSGEPRKKTRKKSGRTALAEAIFSVTKTLFALPFSIAFHRPVSLKKFPNYLEFVSTPIDLSLIKARARAHKYTTYEQFVEDLRLMAGNCQKYNGPGHSLSRISAEMVDMAVETYEKNAENIMRYEEEISEEDRG
jgi:transcription initiation factor TFIID subunit 1, fungi type